VWALAILSACGSDPEPMQTPPDLLPPADDADSSDLASPPPAMPMKLGQGLGDLMGVTRDDRAITWGNNDHHVRAVPLDGSAIVELTTASNGNVTVIGEAVIFADSRGIVVWRSPDSAFVVGQMPAVRGFSASSDGATSVFVLEEPGQSPAAYVIDAAGKHGPFAFGVSAQLPAMVPTANGAAGTMAGAGSTRSAVLVDATGVSPIGSGTVLASDSVGATIAYVDATTLHIRSISSGSERTFALVPHAAGFLTDGQLVVSTTNLTRIPLTGPPIDLPGTSCDYWLGATPDGAFGVCRQSQNVLYLIDLVTPGVARRQLGGFPSGSDVPRGSTPGVFTDDGQFAFYLDGYDPSSSLKPAALTEQPLPNGPLRVVEPMATTAIPAGASRVLYRTADGYLRLVAGDGSVRTLASDPPVSPTSPEYNNFAVDAAHTRAVYNTGGELWVSPL
jgi:hypothetical protein